MIEEKTEKVLLSKKKKQITGMFLFIGII